MSTGFLFQHFDRRILLFIIISALIHTSILIILPIQFKEETHYARFIPINVIELPPAPRAKKKKPEASKWFARRSQVVEKEKSPSVAMGNKRAAKADNNNRKIIKKNGQKGEDKMLISEDTAKGIKGHLMKSRKKVKQKIKKGDISARPLKVKPNLKEFNIRDLPKIQIDSQNKVVEEADILPDRADKRVLTNDSHIYPDRQVGKGSNSPFSLKKDNPVRLYPSKERLAELSREYEEIAPKAEEGKVLSLNTNEHRYWYYMEGIKRKIELLWEYPSVAARNGQQGSLLITFSILKNGGLDNLKLIKGSGYPILDNAAITAIKLAAPFNPFPEDIKLKSVKINASFSYIIRD